MDVDEDEWDQLEENGMDVDGDDTGNTSPMLQYQTGRMILITT